MKPNRAVAEHRHSSLDALDFFPTPPWATRALCEIVLRDALGISLEGKLVWEPAAGEGHMAQVLAEYAGLVVHSDVHDYGIGSQIGSFVGEGFDVIGRKDEPAVDLVISNPPFKLAEAFIARALRVARYSAFLLRTNFIDTQGRYERVFSKTPPIAVAQFAERCPMHEGRWDPDGDTATSYAWFVFDAEATPATHTRLLWIPVGQRDALEHKTDRERFARREESMI